MSSANVSAYSAPRQGRAGSLWSDKARLRKVLMIGGVAVVLAISATVYLIGGRYVGSDDSYVRANKLMVATDVSGLVQTVKQRWQSSGIRSGTRNVAHGNRGRAFTGCEFDQRCATDGMIECRSKHCVYIDQGGRGVT